MACKKCDPHEICEECPEWIFTLADLIMCMMGLFVLLWVLKESGSKASSPAVAQQMQTDWIRGFEQGFSGYIPTEQQDSTKLKKLNGPGEKGMTNDEPQSPEGTEQQSSIIRPGREVTTGGRLLFEKGQATLSTPLKAKLESVAGLIRGHRQIVQIKGHASRDDLGPDAKPAETMALSLRRAQAISDYLESLGVEPDVLRVQGCGTYEPVRQGDSTVAAQSNNRRVEVFASDTLVEQFQDRQAVGVGAPLAAPRGNAHGATGSGHADANH